MTCVGQPGRLISTPVDIVLSTFLGCECWRVGGCDGGPPEAGVTCRFARVFWFTSNLSSCSEV
jgi:hypothetical protein